MAKHCPNCRYSTDDDFEDACPTCSKPLLTDEEHRKGWGAHAGNPDVWYYRRVRVQKAMQTIWVLGAAALLAALAFRLLNGGGP